jgi:TolB protein
MKLIMLRWLLIPVLLFIFTSSLEARIYLDINAPSLIQIPIVVPKWKSVDKTPPTYTAEVYKILVNDLLLSGFFRVIDYQKLPASLQKQEGIPAPATRLQEWMPSGGEILLAGETLFQAEGLHLKLKFHLVDLVEQKVLVSRQIEGSIRNLRSLTHRISDEVILQLTGEKGIHNTRIAYAMAQGETKEIFLADFDGANIRPVTQLGSISLSPVWSPDGKKIAFTCYKKRNPDLYLIDPDGKNLQLFSSSAGVNAAPSWSPDGKQVSLMMASDGKSEIFLLDATGQNPRQLTKSHGNEASPSWSPDGKSIAFVSDRSGSPQVYIMGTDGSNVRRLTFEGSYNTNPSWSPKGDRIAYCSRVDSRFEIFIIALDGSGLQRLTSNSGNNENPVWSPDGRYIAFSSTRTGRSKIFVTNANGFNQRPLAASSPGGESSPAWSGRLE